MSTTIFPRESVVKLPIEITNLKTYLESSGNIYFKINYL